MWYKYLKFSQTRDSYEDQFINKYNNLKSQNISSENIYKELENLKNELTSENPGDSILINYFFNIYSNQLDTRSEDIQMEDQIEQTSLGGDWLEVAESFIGTPYKFGGNDKNGIDCSAFVQKAFPNLPRTANDQMQVGTEIPLNNPNLWQPGDRIYFDMGPRLAKGQADHTGIYLGNNMFIQASSSKGVVKTPLNDYYMQRIIKIMR